MPNDRKNKIWFDGGESEDQSAETEPTEETSTETEATESPKTYDVPGLGECTPEQIAEWHTDSKNKKDWRRKEEERGRANNELRRELEEKNAFLDRRISELESRPVQPTPPRESWRDVRDEPEKKLDLFFGEMDNRVSGMEDRQKKFQDTQTAKEKTRLEQETDQRWTMLADDTLDRLGAPDEPRIREVIQGTMAQQLRKIGKANWSPTEFKKAGEYAINSYKEIKQSGAKELIEGKIKDKKLKTGSPSKPSAPTKVKFAPGQTQEERMKILAKDPNLK